MPAITVIAFLRDNQGGPHAEGFVPSRLSGAVVAHFADDLERAFGGNVKVIDTKLSDLKAGYVGAFIRGNTVALFDGFDAEPEA